MKFSTILALLFAASGEAAAMACPGPAPRSHPRAADGVAWKVLTNRVDQPRQLVQDRLGNVLLAEERGIRRLQLDDAEGMDLCVVNNTLIVVDDKLNHGVSLTADGGTLLASSSTDVYAFPYDAERGVAGPPRAVITGMGQAGHSSRTLYVPPANPGLLLVSRGSSGNVDVGTADVTSGRSQLRAFNVDSLVGGGRTLEYTDGDVVGWGLRNSVGVAQNPTTGDIWSVDNSLDGMHRFGSDIHNSNPGEEMNFHGRPNDTAGYGRNFGYPGCLSVFDTTNVEAYAHGSQKPAVGDQFAGDHQPQYSDLWCQQYSTPPRITFGSHLAPLDVEFLHDGSAALIAFHGSWNRQPPNGYRLSRVSFAGGFPVKRADEADAEEMLLWNANNSDCSTHCFRPAGLLLDKKGRLLMTSDATGEVFLVMGMENKGITADA